MSRHLAEYSPENDRDRKARLAILREEFRRVRRRMSDIKPTIDRYERLAAYQRQLLRLIGDMENWQG